MLLITEPPSGTLILGDETLEDKKKREEDYKIRKLNEDENAE